MEYFMMVRGDSRYICHN